MRVTKKQFEAAKRVAFLLTLAEAAAKVTYRATAQYLDQAFVEVDSWEEDGGYRLSLRVRFREQQVDLVAERRGLREIMYQMTGRSPLKTDMLPPDAIQVVVAFKRDDEDLRRVIDADRRLVDTLGIGPGLLH